MRSLFRLLVGLALLGVWPEAALAWAPEGHKVVAIIAERLISPETRVKVEQLLAEGGDGHLVSVAVWADDLVQAARGQGPLNGNLEAEEFNRKFPRNRTWHFVNLPLGTMSFEEAGPFTSPDDIVHAISDCVRVLESPSGHPQELTKVQALRLLVHLVADIHQPLHCGTGFYRVDRPGVPQLITYPGQARGNPTDRGGNLLFYGTQPTEQLHALWDAVMVAQIHETTDGEALADFLLQNHPATVIAKTPGACEDWAQAWAIESVRVAALAYLGIVFESAAFDADQRLVRIDIKLPSNYLEANQAYAAQQLTKAGVRLAQLLDSIKW